MADQISSELVASFHSRSSGLLRLDQASSLLREMQKLENDYASWKQVTTSRIGGKMEMKHTDHDGDGAVETAPLDN